MRGLPGDGLPCVEMKPFISGNDYSVKSIRPTDAFAFMDNVESNFAEGANNPFGRGVGNGI
jgi:hypothetical protein